MTVTVTYEKNITKGEVKRDARWTVTGEGLEKEAYFYLEQGKKGAKAEAFERAKAFCTQSGYGPLRQTGRGEFVAEKEPSVLTPAA